MKYLKALNQEQKITIQLWAGLLLAFCGIAFLTAGFIFPPIAEIHNSILIAFGEVATFSGSLIGVDYHYKYKQFIKNENNVQEEE